jgi:hypothetical protein
MKPYLAALFLLIAPLAACNDPAGPLAPAQAGKFGCFNVDLAKKTCQATSLYTWDLLGHITDKTQMVMRLGHGVTVVGTSEQPATLENGAVCYAMDDDALSKMTFTRYGLPMDAHDSDIVRTALAKTMPTGKKVCQTFTPEGDAVRLTASVDGQPVGGSGALMVWAAKEDGYFLDAR